MATYIPTGDALQDFAYGYDLIGNILGIRDRTPGSGILNNPDAANTSDPTLSQLLVKGDALNRGFAYDPIYRLLSATGRECDQQPDGPPWLDTPRCTDITKTRSYTENYGYDAMGSMLQLQHQNRTGGFVRDFTVETANNRLKAMQLGQTAYAYTFDVNGNMLSETTSRHFDWNHADQMKAFRTQTDGAEPSVYAQYLFDSSGQRVKKLVRNQGGQVEVTHYIDATFEHYRWGSGTQAGENNRVHVMDDKQRVALVRVGSAHPEDQGPTLQFHLGDHLGSSNVVVDSGGVLTNREEFTPYGETGFGSFAKKRYRFTGMERDEESGLSYHSARYYAPLLARWVSCDPAFASSISNGGETLYSYVGNRPLISVDFDGRLAWLVVIPIALWLLADNENTANAPTGPNSPTYKSQTTRAFFVGAVIDGATIAVFEARMGAIAKGATGLRLAAAHVEAGAFTGVANRAFQDAHQLKLSSAKDYGDAALGGGAIAGVFHVSGRLLSGGGSTRPTPKADVEQPTAAEGGTFYRIPGGRVQAPTPAEAKMFRESVSIRRELSTSRMTDGTVHSCVGDRLEVGLVGGPGVEQTTHTHPTSKVALPSGGDVSGFLDRGGYRGSATHQILGDKWPETRSTLTSMGLDPGAVDPIKYVFDTEGVRAAPRDDEHRILDKVILDRPSSNKR